MNSRVNDTKFKVGKIIINIKTNIQFRIIVSNINFIDYTEVKNDNIDFGAVYSVRTNRLEKSHKLLSEYIKDKLNKL